MNPTVSLQSHVLQRKRLESLLLQDIPVVPGSIVRTFSHVKADDVDLIMAQDAEGLSAGSFILRRGDFARFFLDVWFDQLYRLYEFVKAETHALVRSRAFLKKKKKKKKKTLANRSFLFFSLLTGSYRSMACHCSGKDGNCSSTYFKCLQ